MTRLVGPHRRREPVPLVRNEADHVLAFWRDGLMFVFNFDPARSFTDYGIQVPPSLSRAQLVLDTDETRFGGQGRIAPDQTFFPTDTRMGDELIRQIQLYLPARSAIVLRTRLN